jgi:DNA end-binding protein Ku
MPQRPIWRGHLRLALVSCPVALYAAHHERENPHFHFINPETGHRVNMVTLDAENRHQVERRDLVRGYEFKKDHYLILTDEDFDSVRIDSSATLSITKFIERDALDPISLDASYYMAPDGDSGLDVFAVLRDAIARTKRVALSRVVIARRERAVAILPLGRGLAAHTLFDPRELNDPEPLFEDIPDAKPDADMVELATQLIQRQAGRYDPADAEDRYAARLRELIAAKLKGEGLASEPEPEPDNVIDLMAALKQSLGQADAAPARSRRPGRASPAAKATPPPAPAKTPARGSAPATRRRAR